MQGENSKAPITLLLQRANEGDGNARCEMIQAVYDELRRLAESRMRNERADHTLSSTALVNELCVKLFLAKSLPAGSRHQFLSYAAKAMRSLLVDHARKRQTQKRSGDRKRIEFDEAIVAAEEQSEDFLALDRALEKLSEIDERKAQIVEMKYFAGLSLSDIAESLQISVSTVKRDWDVARTLLVKELH